MAETVSVKVSNSSTNYPSSARNSRHGTLQSTVTTVASSSSTQRPLGQSFREMEQQASRPAELLADSYSFSSSPLDSIAPALWPGLPRLSTVSESDQLELSFADIAETRLSNDERDIVRSETETKQKVKSKDKTQGIRRAISVGSNKVKRVSTKLRQSSPMILKEHLRKGLDRTSSTNTDKPTSLASPNQYITQQNHRKKEDTTSSASYNRQSLTKVHAEISHPSQSANSHGPDGIKQSIGSIPRQNLHQPKRRENSGVKNGAVAYKDSRNGSTWPAQQ